MRRVLLGFLLGSACVGASGEALPHEFWQPHVDFYGRTNGYRRGIGLAVVLPFWQQPCGLTMVQGTWGRWFNQWSGSVGLIHRCLWGQTRAWGINGFVDLSRSNGNHTYVQVGLGGEILAECWEARVNGYLPFMDSRFVDRRDVSTVSTGGANMGIDRRIVERREFAYMGLDGEMGYGFPFYSDGSLWGFLGYRYFDRNGARVIQGPRVRAEYRLDNFMGLCGAQLIAGAFYEYDRVHRHEGGAELGLRIPLSGPSASNGCGPSRLYRRMGYRVIRNEAPLVERHERVIFESRSTLLYDDLPLQYFVVSARGRGSGAEGDPIDLKGALRRAREGDYLIVEDSLKLGEVSELLPKMRVYGFGESDRVTVPFQGAGLDSPVHKYTFKRESTDPIELSGHELKLARGVELTDLRFANGLNMDNVTGVELHRVTLGGPLKMSGSTSLIASELVIAEAQQPALQLKDVTGAVSIRDGDLSSGIAISGGSPQLMLAGAVRSGQEALLAIRDVGESSTISVCPHRRVSRFKPVPGASGRYVAELQGGLEGARIEIAKSDASVNISGAKLSGPVVIDDCKGSILLTNSWVDVVGKSSILARKVAELSVRDCYIGGSAGKEGTARIMVEDGVANLSITGNAIVGVPANGAGVQLKGEIARSARLRMCDNRIEGHDSVVGLDAKPSSGGLAGIMVGNRIAAKQPMVSSVNRNVELELDDNHCLKGP